MDKIAGSGNRYFRGLLARGFVPEKVPRDMIYSGWDMSERFHHKANRVFPLIKTLFERGATYMKDGQKRPLVRFCQPPHMKCFLGVERDPDAVAAFDKELMQGRVWRPREEYLTQPQLWTRGVSEEAIRAVLRHLYEIKATYEKDGVPHLAVECYASGPRKTVLGLANTIEARALFAQHLIAYKKERKELHRKKVCAGRGLNETLEESLVGHTNLTLDDVRNLGHGFYNRVSAVRRQMTKWNNAGHSFRRVMSWSLPGNRGKCAAPWAVFSGWKREVELLKGIILLAEYCKSNNLDFHTEFEKDTRRTKENRGR